MNNVAMNISVQVIVWIYTFNYLGYAPMSGIDASYENSIFNHFSNYQTVLHSHLPYFTSSPKMYCCSNLSTFSPALDVWLLILAVLLGFEGYHVLVWVCVFLMADDVERLSVCLLPFACLFCRNIYSGPLPIFKLGFIFLDVFFML